MTNLHTSPIKKQYANAKLSAEDAAYFQNNGAKVAENIVVLGQLPLIKNGYGGTLEIGSNTVLNSDNVNSNTPIPTPVKFVLGVNSKITIGDDCDLNGACIVSYLSVSIGNRVQIGAAGLISDTDLHPIALSDRKKQKLGLAYPFESVAKSQVVIDDDVWIGFNVMILKGVHIGAGSIVGAGSVVTKDVPPLTIVAGNPARIIGVVNDN